jgi:hypothetical protein
LAFLRVHERRLSVPTSARNVLWILGLVLILGAAEYGLAIQSARPHGNVDVGAGPDASGSDSSIDTNDFSSHYVR